MRVEEKQKSLHGTFLLSFFHVLTSRLIYKSITHTCARVERKTRTLANRLDELGQGAYMWLDR